MDVFEVICSDCGHKFKINEESGKYTPNKCPSCEKEINYLKVPIDGSRIIAFVKEK